MYEHVYYLQFPLEYLGQTPAIRSRQKASIWSETASGRGTCLSRQRPLTMQCHLRQWAGIWD